MFAGSNFCAFAFFFLFHDTQNKKVLVFGEFLSITGIEISAQR